MFSRSSFCVLPLIFDNPDEYSKILTKHFTDVETEDFIGSIFLPAETIFSRGYTPALNRSFQSFLHLIKSRQAIA